MERIELNFKQLNMAALSLPKRPKLVIATFAFGILSLSSGSCTKSAQTPKAPTVSSRTALLAKGVWHMALWEVLKTDGTWLSLQLTPLQQSRHITYHADHTFVASSLNQSGVIATGTGSWEFSNDESTIVTHEDGATSTTDIGILDGTKLQEKESLGTYDLPNGDGTYAHYVGVRFTWLH